ncbi:MAG: signal recognition particle protein [Candidatus Melainabacteria bacterium]|nr:signal recognition particle protein [Candidatus Melainabacteria bacterium]
MFNTLSDNLQNVFTSLRGKSQITEENIEDAIREVKRSLIDADVSLKAIKTFTGHVKEKALGEAVIKGVSPCDQFIKIVHDELVLLLGSNETQLNLQVSPLPNIILLLGLQGAGKTTSAAKLAQYLKKQGKNPLLVPLDLKRPAAIEQLQALGKQIEIPVYISNGPVTSDKGPIDLAKNSLEFAKNNNHDVIILDTAGRLQIDTELMAELLLVEKITNPVEKLLVIDSMIGQDAASIAQAFNTQIGITGIILTKLDGDARGGAALSVVEETKKPIKFAGIGEKMDALQVFYPERIASRILGMGDVLTFIEQAQEKIKEEEAKEIEKNLLKEFNFETFLQAQGMMSKLGDFSSIFNMLGMGGMLNQAGVGLNKDMQNKMLQEGESKIRRFRPLIQSMTIRERRNPDLLNSGRKARITRGAGLKMQDVDKLISEFRQTKKVMDKIKPLMGMFQGGGLNPGDMLKGLAEGGPSQGTNRAQRRLSKGFKPKKNK